MSCLLERSVISFIVATVDVVVHLSKDFRHVADAHSEEDVVILVTL